MKPSGPGVLFLGRFLITSSILLLVIGLFRFSVSSLVSLGRLYFSRKLFISSRLSSLLAFNFSLYSLIILCISVVPVVIFPFLFLILFMCVDSLFFLISLARGLSILFIFSKNQLLLSLILSIVLFFSILFMLCIFKER